MAGIISKWKFTLGGALLLDFGHKLLSEVEFTPQGLVQVVPLIRADRPLLRQGRNVSVSIRWQRYVDFDTDQDARLALLDGLTAPLLADEPAVLVIEVAGDAPEERGFEKCLLVSATPVRQMEGPFPRLILAYELIATEPTPEA